MKKDLCDRLFKFSVDVIKFLRNIRNTHEFAVLKTQLTKSATSNGANYEESQAGSSKADFKYKVIISLKEMRESNYWLRIFKAIDMRYNETVIFLIQESEELKKSLGSICSKVNVKQNVK